MWNDEDNNPYGTSFERRDSTSSAANPSSPSSHDEPVADPGWEIVENAYGGPQTPSTTSDAHDTENDARPRQYDTSDAGSDDEYGGSTLEAPKRKKGGYDSRIEQILYENPELPILIVDAGKSLESGGKYIVYTIRTGDLEVRRRYSEFASLRDALSRLHPTLVMPPIPEKHTMADYAANPTKAKQDQQIIDLRKRMLAVFLNRCRRMDEVRNDGVWWRFLDPNSSWNEVLHSHPIASIPKSNMKAPPLDPANPSPAHAFLPVPAASAKLKAASSHSTNAQGMPNQPPEYAASPSTAAHTIPGIQVHGRFPPDSQNLNEQALDPYFINFEAGTKELELLLTGPIEKVNRRTLQHLQSLSSDLAELGARFNGFSLSEPSTSLAAAIERVGQAVDSSYLATEELAGSLGASFAEPMRESAQFAGVVRAVLRYRVLKRVQQEMTNDELAKKKILLESLERSETEAKRIEQYLNNSGTGNLPRRSNSSARDPLSTRRGENAQEDTASIDSDFPPTHDGGSSPPSATQGAPEELASPVHRKSSSGNFITNKIFGRISHAVHGVVDVDPERTRRDQIGKTRESIEQLEQAQKASEQDVRNASAGVLKDLKRFQAEKEDDLRRYMLAYAKSQIEWAKKNKETWEEAKSEINKIDES
ncbi:related to Cvt pathway protein CVT20 [Rhynchosporium graminicola]|uniref:Related to Cvt pathway protein CVT20 n=1 Tax=Rhynchosporium graminicola TaxID=2792576 RepID=A0A1E1LA32_9HELO|nr:related to Cvt pathway protein CVT20 [Rhynchosporium commune]